jgi:hypothetical protein
MRVVDVEQGSADWFAARLGVPTASCFKDIITSRGKKATAFDRYANTLVAERLMGHPPESFESDWMRRGTELEPQAREFYQFAKDVDVEQVGFCLLDDGSAGASPDGLTPAGGLEIKCPAPHTHVEYLTKGKLPAAYVPQVQGQMWICERDHWDFLSFHPEMPPLLLRVDRDQKFIDTLAGLIRELNERIESSIATINAHHGEEAAA